jgi:hypothetical protein
MAEFPKYAVKQRETTPTVYFAEDRLSHVPRPVQGLTEATILVSATLTTPQSLTGGPDPRWAIFSWKRLRKMDLDRFVIGPAGVSWQWTGELFFLGRSRAALRRIFFTLIS